MVPIKIYLDLKKVGLQQVMNRAALPTDETEVHIASIDLPEVLA